MRVWGLILGVLLTGVIFPVEPLPLVSLVICMALAAANQERLGTRPLLTLAALFVFPLLLTHSEMQELQPPALEFEARDLGRVVNLDSYLAPEDMEAMTEVLDSARPLIDHPNASQLFSDTQLPDYISLSLLNLNLQSIAWKGGWFSEVTRELQSDESRLVLRDGRLFFVTMTPLPSAEQPRGFITLELLLLSNHPREQERAYIPSLTPAFKQYRSVVTDPNNYGFLDHLAGQFGVQPPPFEMHFVPLLKKAPLVDWAAFGFALLFLGSVLFLCNNLRPLEASGFLLLYLTILAIPRPEQLDYLSVFASFLFGNRDLAGLLSSPFHFFISVGLLLQLLRLVAQKLAKGPAGVIAVYLVALAACLFLPAYLQDTNSYSFVHPLDALLEPGTGLQFLGFLLLFAMLVNWFDFGAALGLQVKLPIVLASCAAVAFFLPGHLIAAGSISLIWIIRDYQAPHALKAALAVMIFYPALVQKEQKEEVNYIRDNVLDEITLMMERNYFRMGRIIQRIPELQHSLQAGPHRHLMETFARNSGLFEDEIDFALQLTRPGGRVVSQVSRQISLDENLPIGAEDRITTTTPEWLTFRRTLESNEGLFDLTVVLGNDYRNLSLIRKLRFLSENEGVKEMPYLAYIVDVFDEEAKPLYTQRKPNPLRTEDLEQLKQSRWFWRVEGRNTVFFFSDRDFYYRITHKATPLKMIFIRSLSLFLVIYFLIRMLRLIQRPGRGLLARWNRSFAIKLAGFIFISSVLPTLFLGYFLLNTIQNNQERAEQDMARSQILAVKGLLRDSVQPGRGPFSIPIQRYAIVLGEDLSLYVNGSLLRTSQPEAFRRGLMKRRLPYDLAKSLYLDHVPYVQEKEAGGPAITYTPLELGPNQSGVLAMTMIPFSTSQRIRWLEQLEFTITLLLGLMFAMGMTARILSRYFLDPVAAITRRATRVARGMQYKPIPLDRQDELQQMVDAFNTMQERVQASQVKLETQLQLLDETLKSMSGGLLGFDAAGRLSLKNNRAMELLHTDTAPRDLDDLMTQIPELEAVKQAFEDGRDYDVGWTTERDGEPRELLARLLMVPASRAGDLSAIVALEDITDALAANRFKAWSEMARRVAHEIKNPLTPIQLELDHLLRLYQDKHPQFGEALEEAVDEIREQVFHLQKTATEFGDYARPLELDKHPVNVNDLLSNLLEPYRKTMPDMEITVQLDATMDLMADERLLTRCFSNLIVNAMQAMENIGRLRLVTFNDTETLTIWIEDTGPGIPESERARVFEAYFSTKNMGTGLGLVLARRYVTEHDGALRIDPAYTEGTRFEITLPLHAPESAE